MHTIKNYVIFSITLLLFALKSILSSVNIITPSFFLSVFAWSISQGPIKKTESLLNI